MTTMTNNNLLKKFKEYDKDKPQKVTEISGLLGIPINGRLTVEVPNRNGFVYVRLRNNTNELIQAFNEKVSPAYNLPVLVKWVVNRYEVIGRDTSRYQDWGSYSAFLPRHGSQHSLNFEDGQGGDVSFIYSRQFMPFATIPSGTDGAGTVFVMPHVYRDPINASWNYIGDESSQNFLPAKPTGTSARMMLLVWNLSTSDPLIITGSFFAESLTGTSAILPYVPTVTNQNHIPLAAIRLVSGTQSLLWDNIYDMRQYAVTTPPTFGGGFGIWDEGIPQGTGTILNFVGGSVDVSISGTVARIHISGSGGGTIFAQDEGVPLGTPTTFNFVGSNVDASISGSVVRVFVTGSVGGINTGTLDARYLKLVADNDPLTGRLDIIPSTDLNALSTRVNGDSTPIYGEQYPFSGSTGPNKVLTLLRRYDSTGVVFNKSVIQAVTYNSGTTTGGLIDYIINDNTRISLNPSIYNTGTAYFLDTATTLINDGKLLSLSNAGNEKFYVDYSGSAYSNGFLVGGIAETNTNDIFRCDNPGGVSAFAGTIATLPGGAVLTYTVTSGQEGAMVPVSTSQLAKMRLYNTTRGTSALISDCVTGTNTITLTANVPAGWAVTDVITIASQTVSGGGLSWVDLQITSGLTGKTAVFMKIIINSATVGDGLRLHPFNASHSASKYDVVFALTTAQNTNGFALISVTSNVFSISWTGTPSACILREAGYLS